MPEALAGALLYSSKTRYRICQCYRDQNVDVMKKFGITLILAGMSLIAALSLDVAKKNRSVLTIGRGVHNKEIALIRVFTTIGTVLVIAGVSATVLDKRP
jgi:hypothetical protein